MGTAERRRELLRILCRRGHETIKKLANELGVSERTIQRDVEILSMSEPIYTQSGRYGGVYVMEGYTLDRMYMNDAEISMLKKLSQATSSDSSLLSMNERHLLGLLISQYTKPNSKKEGNNHEQTRKTAC